VGMDDGLRLIGQNGHRGGVAVGGLMMTKSVDRHVVKGDRFGWLVPCAGTTESGSGLPDVAGELPAGCRVTQGWIEL
jgi:hypothetical protein